MWCKRTDQFLHGVHQITVPANISNLPATPVQPRAMGAVTLSAKNTPRGTALADLRQSGALKALFPRPNSAALQAIMINTAGGITGGDDFSLTASAGENTHLSLTTQAAERVYRAQPDQVAAVNNRLFVSAGARLDWLPQETILFEASALKRRMQVELDKDASLLLVEPLVFGRAAMGETLNSAYFSDRIDIRRQGQPLFLDAMTLHGNVTGHLAASQIAANAGAMALIVYIAADAEAQLAPLRALLPEAAGASLIEPNLLVARILATDSFDLRQSLVPALQRLTNDTLPRSWMT